MTNDETGAHRAQVSYDANSISAHIGNNNSEDAKAYLQAMRSHISRYNAENPHPKFKRNFHLPPGEKESIRHAAGNDLLDEKILNNFEGVRHAYFSHSSLSSSLRKHIIAELRTELAHNHALFAKNVRDVTPMVAPTIYNGKIDPQLREFYLDRGISSSKLYDVIKGHPRTIVEALEKEAGKTNSHLHYRKHTPLMQAGTMVEGIPPMADGLTCEAKAFLQMVRAKQPSLAFILGDQNYLPSGQGAAIEQLAAQATRYSEIYDLGSKHAPLSASQANTMLRRFAAVCAMSETGLNTHENQSLERLRPAILCELASELQQNMHALDSDYTDRLMHATVFHGAIGPALRKEYPEIDKDVILTLVKNNSDPRKHLAVIAAKRNSINEPEFTDYIRNHPGKYRSMQAASGAPYPREAMRMVMGGASTADIKHMLAAGKESAQTHATRALKPMIDPTPSR